MNALKKFDDFLLSYVEININSELRKMALRNASAISNKIMGSGMTLRKSEVTEQDIKLVIQLQECLDEINYIKGWIDGDKTEVFIEFDILCRYLILSKLNSKECFEIISNIIKTNLELAKGVTRKLEYEFPEFYMISFKKMSNLTKQEKDNIIKYSEYINLSPEDLNKEEKQKIRYVINRCKDLIVENPGEILNKMDRFEEIYLKKFDTFAIEDAIEIVDILSFLGINEQLLSKIFVSLKKDIERRKIESSVPTVKVVDSIKQKKTNIITDKEYKEIKRELKSYFDLCNIQKIRELEDDEIIHCIELLVKIDTPIEEINRFISFFKLSNNEYSAKHVDLLNSTNAISLYIDLYEKLKYYESKLNILEELEYIESCFKEIFLCSDEDYLFYKQEIENMLIKILDLIPQTYDYEISKIQKRINLKK